MPVILFIVILLILVLVHEFGHFIVAKKSGIRVDEFGFGFPPRILYKQIGETKYSFNLIPFGGFVKIFGENPDEESINGPDKERSFVHKPKYIQAAVLFAGVFFNFLLAWFLLSVGFMSGMPASQASYPNQIIDSHLTVIGVTDDSPAYKAGLIPGDEIISIVDNLNNESPENLDLLSVQNFIGVKAGETLVVNINRKGENKNLEVVPEAGIINDRAAIGISMDNIGVLKLPVHKALFQGLVSASNMTVQTAKSFGILIRDAFTGKADMSQVTGPVGIVGVVGDAYNFGLIYLLSFAALISINLAIINLIPFPALDGGRLFFLLIEKIKGSPIKPAFANIVNTVGFGLLLLLMVVVTYHDIVKLIN